MCCLHRLNSRQWLDVPPTPHGSVATALGSGCFFVESRVTDDSAPRLNHTMNHTVGKLMSHAVGWAVKNSDGGFMGNSESELVRALHRESPPSTATPSQRWNFGQSYGLPTPILKIDSTYTELIIHILGHIVVLNGKVMSIDPYSFTKHKRKLKSNRRPSPSVYDYLFGFPCLPFSSAVCLIRCRRSATDSEVHSQCFKRRNFRLSIFNSIKCELKYRRVTKR